MVKRRRDPLAIVWKTKAKRIKVRHRYKKFTVVPQNYDFGANWTSILLPLIKTDVMQKAIMEGMARVLDQEGDPDYDITKPPARYCVSPIWSDLQLDYDNMAVAKWTADGKLSKKENRILHPPPYDEDFSGIDRHSPEYEALQSKTWDNIALKYRKANGTDIWQNQLESYVVFHECEAWNATFGIALARLAVPEEKWRVVRRPAHTTVMNQDNTRCFDILLWGCGHLRKHVLASSASEFDSLEHSMNAEEHDATFGGKEVRDMLNGNKLPTSIRHPMTLNALNLPTVNS